VAPLYSQVLGSLFVASYDSQGYGGGIRTRLHAGDLTLNLLQIIYKNSVHTSQETHYVSVTETSRLMPRKTVAVYCENHTEHINTLCGQKTQSVPYRKHVTSPLQKPTG
jgi:hypothetical protein